MSDAPANYVKVIGSLKEKIRLARQKVSLSVNKELLQVYWEIGAIISQQQKEAGWGARVIDRMAADLKMEFPDFRGLSVRNLKYMRSFADAYPQFGQQPAAQMQTAENQSIIIVQQVAAQLPWGHHQVLLDKVKDPEQRMFYIQKAIENGWSRDVTVHQVETNLYQRTGKAITNFKTTLPNTQSDLAQQTIKNPYIFDFLTFTEEVKERELEKALIQHLKKFMLELGKGFAWVGNQKNLEVAGDDFFLDLLFYNYHMHCFVVFELKVGEFKPEFTGKLNFYVNAINEQLTGSADKPTIGILLCKTPNETVVKYSLQGIESPIGVSSYEFSKALPADIKGELPTIEELEQEIEQSYEELKNPAQKRMDALKEKLAQIKGPEVNQVATTPILFAIIDESLVPLFGRLIKCMEEIKPLFVSENYFWEGKNGNLTHLQEMAAIWKNEEFLKQNGPFYFSYQLHGFKRAGTEAFNVSYQLIIRFDVYWYGIILTNYNNQQPFLKKLYGEQLTNEDIDTITDIVHEAMVKDIDRNIENIKR